MTRKERQERNDGFMLWFIGRAIDLEVKRAGIRGMSAMVSAALTLAAEQPDMRRILGLDSKWKRDAK